MIAALEGTTMDGSTPQLVRCRGTLPDGSECGQLLARRFTAGGLEVVVKGERYDERGRVCVTCPLCQTRRRLYPTKQAA